MEISIGGPEIEAIIYVVAMSSALLLPVVVSPLASSAVDVASFAIADAYAELCPGIMYIIHTYVYIYMYMACIFVSPFTCYVPEYMFVVSFRLLMSSIQ